MFDVTDIAASSDALERLVVSGTSRVAFDIPLNFTTDLDAGRPTHVQAPQSASSTFCWPSSR